MSQRAVLQIDPAGSDMSEMMRAGVWPGGPK